MPTFVEMQQQVSALQMRKAVLLMLMETIDADYRSIGGTRPKKAVKSDEGVIVPEEVLDSVAGDISMQIRTIEQEIAGIVTTPMAPAAPQPAPGEGT